VLWDIPRKLPKEAKVYLCIAGNSWTLADSTKEQILGGKNHREDFQICVVIIQNICNVDVHQGLRFKFCFGMSSKCIKFRHITRCMSSECMRFRCEFEVRVRRLNLSM
jgi:hypothetical protein